MPLAQARHLPLLLLPDRARRPHAPPSLPFLLLRTLPLPPLITLPPLQMMELLDHIPRSVATTGRYAREIFTREGRLRHIHRLNHWPLERVLEEKYKFPREEVRRCCTADRTAALPLLPPWCTALVRCQLLRSPTAPHPAAHRCINPTPTHLPHPAQLR